MGDSGSHMTIYIQERLKKMKKDKERELNYDNVDMVFCVEHVNIIGWFKTNCNLFLSI
jgi:hypothetical protein